MTRTIEEIKNAYLTREFETKLPLVSTRNYLLQDHVFDEDKSVRWNKEQVKIQNREIEEKIKERRKDSSRLQSQLTEEILTIIQSQYRFNKEQAQKIYSYVYSEYHSSMIEVFDRLEEIADMVEQVIELES